MSLSTFLFSLSLFPLSKNALLSLFFTLSYIYCFMRISLSFPVSVTFSLSLLLVSILSHSLFNHHYHYHHNHHHVISLSRIDSFSLSLFPCLSALFITLSRCNQYWIQTVWHYVQYNILPWVRLSVMTSKFNNRLYNEQDIANVMICTVRATVQSPFREDESSVSVEEYLKHTN